MKMFSETFSSSYNFLLLLSIAKFVVSAKFVDNPKVIVDILR